MPVQLICMCVCVRGAGKGRLSITTTKSLIGREKKREREREGKNQKGVQKKGKSTQKGLAYYMSQKSALFAIYILLSLPTEFILIFVCPACNTYTWLPPGAAKYTVHGNLCMALHIRPSVHARLQG